MAERLKGRDLMLFIKDDLKSTYSALAFAKTCNLNINATTQKVFDKDSAKTGDLEHIGSEWTMDSNCAVGADNTSTDRFIELVQNGKKVSVVWALVATPNANGLQPSTPWAPKEHNGYEGEAMVTSVQENAPAEGTAEFTITLTGCSQLTKRK